MCDSAPGDDHRGINMVGFRIAQWVHVCLCNCHRSRSYDRQATLCRMHLQPGKALFYWKDLPVTNAEANVPGQLQDVANLLQAH